MYSRVDNSNGRVLAMTQGTVTEMNKATATMRILLSALMSSSKIDLCRLYYVIIVHIYTRLMRILCKIIKEFNCSYG